MAWKVKEVAEERGLNAHQLAQRAELAYTTVRGVWHNESTRVDMQTLQKLARVLQVEPGELIGRDE